MRPEGISSVCNGLVWRVDVGLASTESQAGRAGASQILEILSSSACTKDCVSRKRSEDKLRVMGVNEASMGAHQGVFFNSQINVITTTKMRNFHVAGAWHDINPIPPFAGLTTQLGSLRGQ